MTSVVTPAVVDTSSTRTQQTKRKKRPSKSERKRRKRQREAEAAAAVKNETENDSSSSKNNENSQSASKEISNVVTQPVLETCNVDKVEHKNDIIPDEHQLTLINENSILVRSVKFVYPIKEKTTAHGKPLSYVHSKLKKHEGDKILRQGNDVDNGTSNTAKQETEETKLMDKSIDDILFPEKKEQKASLDDENQTNVENHQPPKKMDNEKDVIETREETTLKQANSKEQNVQVNEVSPETNKPEIKSNTDDAEPLRRGRARSDSLSDPVKMCLTGRTVEDVIRDKSGRRPRSNSTDSELKLPIRGLCDERVVIQNHVWDFSVFQRAPPRGFINLGNTCFLNSTLQCLAYLPTFCQCVSMLPNGNAQSSKMKSNNTGLHITMVLKTLLRKIHGLDGEIKQAPISPKHIVRSISLLGGNHRGYKFRPGRQEDAHEFLVHLLDAMNDGELKAAGINQKKSGWRDRLPIPRLDETTLTHRMFGGYLRSQVRCTRCKYKSNTYDPFLDLSLEVSSKKIGSLYDALTEYTRKETLDAANKWKCSGCKKHVCATKQLTIFRPPLTLCIQLKRFSFGGVFGGFMHHQGYSHFAGKGMGMAKGGSKVQKLIEFPASLKLPLSDGRKCEYILTGVIVHIGGSATSGHYTAFVRRTSKNNTVQWLNVDDSFVEPVPEKTVLRNKDAYVLFYCRKEVQLEMPSIPQSCSSESSNSSKDENMSTKKKKKVENQSNEVVSEHNNSDTVNVQHPSLNSSEKSQIDNKPMELKRAPIPSPPDEELERTPSPLPTNKENLSNGTQSTSSNTELGRTNIPLAPNKENSSNGTQSTSSNIIAIYRDGKEDNNDHSQTEKSPEKVQATIGVESPSLKSNETSVMANDATKKSHSSDTRKKEISLDMGSMGRVKVMLRSLKARNKAWKPLPKAKEGPTKENSLLGERAIGGWDDDDDESKETETRNTSLEKEAKIRRTIFSETKLHEKSRKRKMYLDSWDRALDAGKVKKVKGKTTTSHSSEHITSRENPFHRIQQSMLQMKSGPKGFHKTSKQTRSKK